MDALSSAAVAGAGQRVFAEGRAATQAKNEVQTSIQRHGVVTLDVGGGFELGVVGVCKLAVKGWCVGSESDELCARAAGSQPSLQLCCSSVPATNCARAADFQLEGVEKTNTSSRVRSGLQTRSLRFFELIFRHGMSRSFWTENQQLRVAFRVHCAGSLVWQTLSHFSLTCSSLSSLSRLLSFSLFLLLSKFRYQFYQKN